MTIDEMIAVLEAAKAGKKIQLRPKRAYESERTWRDAVLNMDGSESWNFNACDYRVKPEPREWWLCDGRDHECWVVASPEHDSSKCGGEKVHVREVLP